jgi:hypothetical protein
MSVMLVTARVAARPTPPYVEVVALTAHPCPTSAPLFVPMVNMSLVPLKAMLRYRVSLVMVL